ncbi:hypothetical protein NHP21011_13040 [Helicobacter heilmannii]|uniref:hypothetical protein n=1 Tax=Helicobacter heilmannii TaxID=35817 RepID=UPI00244D86C6|nr:hypothetical protein [Helicobacter heilmannii]GMB95205.1 hypothetical protein NHP21011_13040 [Helicobacter heilmannii]
MHEDILKEWTQREAKALKTFWLHGHTHTCTTELPSLDTINMCIDFRYHAKWPIFCFEDFLVRMP